MTKINTKLNLFVAKLEALYDIEAELEKALPKMEKASSDEALKEGFKMHLKETKEHSSRLEQAFKLLDVKPKKLKSEGIRGIIKDGSWVIKTPMPAEIKDFMLAGAARYAEHYEMAGYETAILESKKFKLDDITNLLVETLSEEQAADNKLVEFIGGSVEDELGQDISGSDEFSDDIEDE